MKMKKSLAVLAAILAMAALSVAASIPAGTRISVRSSTSLNSGTAHVGQTWQGSVANSVVVNGVTIAKSGDPVTGVVTTAKDSGRLHAPGVLGVRLTSVAGTPVSSTTHVVSGKSHMKSNAEKIGGGAAAGALIGALAGGGKGAAIGAGVGAGAGTGVAMYTGKQQAVIPAESVMSFIISTNGSTSATLKRRSH